MAPHDDLTAERAAKLIKDLFVLHLDDDGEPDETDVLALVDLQKTARQEALREAAQQARFGAMELRAMNEPLQTDRLGYGQKALQDFADILDRLASEGA